MNENYFNWLDEEFKDEIPSNHNISGENELTPSFSPKTWFENHGRYIIKDVESWLKNQAITKLTFSGITPENVEYVRSDIWSFAVEEEMNKLANIYGINR